MEHETVHELTAAYALDALDDREREAYEAHLASCEGCRGELAELADTAEALAYAPSGPPPPPALRERLLESVRGERGVVVPLRRYRLLRAAPFAAAAAAAAAVVLGIWATSLSHRLHGERDARRGDRQALAVLRDPNAIRTPLSGSAGTLVVAPSGRGILVVDRLPRAANGRTYEAWVIAPHNLPQRAGLFRGGGAVVNLERRVPFGAKVAITVEPAAGSPQPTTRPVTSAVNS
jgi:anti-sigma factor RsiW